jgi:hypothetical protein
VCGPTLDVRAVYSSPNAIDFEQGALIGVDGVKLGDRDIGPGPSTGRFASVVAARVACHTELDVRGVCDGVPAYETTTGAEFHCAFRVVYVCRISFAVVAPMGHGMFREALLEHIEGWQTRDYDAEMGFKRREETDGCVVPGRVLVGCELDHPFQP